MTCGLLIVMATEVDALHGDLRSLQVLHLTLLITSCSKILTILVSDLVSNSQLPRIYLQISIAKDLSAHGQIHSSSTMDGSLVSQT